MSLRVSICLSLSAESRKAEGRSLSCCSLEEAQKSDEKAGGGEGRSGCAGGAGAERSEWYNR